MALQKFCRLIEGRGTLFGSVGPPNLCAGTLAVGIAKVAVHRRSWTEECPWELDPHASWPPTHRQMNCPGVDRNSSQALKKTQDCYPWPPVGKVLCFLMYWITGKSHAQSLGAPQKEYWGITVWKCCNCWRQSGVEIGEKLHDLHCRCRHKNSSLFVPWEDWQPHHRGLIAEKCISPLSEEIFSSIFQHW